jgi:alpha-mannosidase
LANCKPAVHLICNAHLDPVWQWRWEEGASEALATFRNAVDLVDEHPGLIFCHNEAVLYQWAERYDPGLFEAIRCLVRAGRWAVSGGWFLQPDTNLPGAESLIRQVAEGRRYFAEKFGARPRVAYNFDSFGHSAGLPQILRLAGYEMYIHMRPQAHELDLPADLYRWRGADGAVIPAYRIAVGLYHTERDNIGDRLRAGVALAVEIGRDVPVFWGLGNHGGGATRADLRTIDAFMQTEDRVRIIHSTPDAFFDAVRQAAAVAPVFGGELQRVFTGCYTSLSRLKRRAVRSLGTLVQSEAISSAAWWLHRQEFPAEALREAWRLHLANDFHDIITGSCVEPAEADALDGYGQADGIARAARLGAVAGLNRRGTPGPPLPLTVANANPALPRVPVEFECMADYRPFWKGRWHLRLFRADGREVPCQEEQPEALLPFNDWRRKLCFVDDLPGVGITRYEVRAFEGAAPGKRKQGPAGKKGRPPKGRAPIFRISRASGLVTSLRTPAGHECLAGPLFEPIVIEDTADSWGTGQWSYGKVVGRFKPDGPPHIIASGPVRTVTQTVLSFKRSRIVMDVHSFPDWPVLEFRLRVTWNEERRRLKLRVPTTLQAASAVCEVPGAAVSRPASGEESVHGRWLLVEGRIKGRAAALGIVNNGQPGYDFRDGEVRLSVLRSTAYCHERGFDLDCAGLNEKRTHTSGTCPPAWKFSDIGVHDVRLLVAVGEPDGVKDMLPGLADFLSVPPAVYAHLPFGDAEAEDLTTRRHAPEVPTPGARLVDEYRKARGDTYPGHVSQTETLLSLAPSNIRLLACKPSWDGVALVIRAQEAVGTKTRARLTVCLPDEKKTPAEVRSSQSARPFSAAAVGPTLLPAGARFEKRGGDRTGHSQMARVSLSFNPFEIKTLRVEKDGTWLEVPLIEEVPT